jgi:hypothetical protein
LNVQLSGYRPYPRVFSVPQDGDVLLRLSKVAGTLSIVSDPSGASIEIDGKPQSMPTPARFDLAPGTYHIKVVRNGAVADFEVQLGDGQFITKRVMF